MLAIFAYACTGRSRGWHLGLVWRLRVAAQPEFRCSTVVLKTVDFVEGRG